ncbi:MAG: cobalt-precorrin-6A reductase [Kiloniellaceae bacterium]
MAEPTKLLILGGTGEAATLARRLARDPNIAVITSLAGRTRNPAAVPGRLRRGGFGGVAGLADYLRHEAIDLVVDATHPFAVGMTRNAAEACKTAGLPHLILARPGWQRRAGDRWIEVENTQAAAAALPGLGRRVFLSSGRGELPAFSGLRDHRFLVRLIDRPRAPLPLADYELILGRGPFSAEHETALFKAHAIEVLVSKNSGGRATYGKIEAARGLGLPVVMIARPPLPEGETVERVDQALDWIEARRA